MRSAQSICLPCTDIPHCQTCETNGKCTQCLTDYWIDFSTGIIFITKKTIKHAHHAFFTNVKLVIMGQCVHLAKKDILYIQYIKFVFNANFPVVNVT